jgi:micrococcal nuclease
MSLLRTKKKGCFADESRIYLQSLVQGKELHLVFDPTQAKTDSYKRLLVYVYTDDALINEKILAQGFAKEYTFKTPYQQRDVFLEAQQEAQAEKR